jgi:alkanesulfonate monooxygenase SsuD/methylene tetrahydromethanopterin reductase-like flavin-dependent oxidoreductase (luciferase family)
MRLGFALFAGIAADVIRATAREADSRGLDSFWLNHPGSIDGLAALGQAAAETRRIALGVGVVPLHTRGPDSVVEGVRAARLPLDRLLLGVGSPNPQALERVRAGVAALRATLATRVVVAALGPKMCRLAGEVADGVLFNWLTPDHARKSADLVRAGAAAAGRQPPTIFAYIRVALGPGASARLAEEGLRYGAIPAYKANFERMGVKPLETAVDAPNAAAVAPALARWEGVVDELVVRAITGRDTVDESLALLEALRS